MQLADTLARLSIALHDPISEHAELVRSLREPAKKLAPSERKLAHTASAEGYSPVDWGERGFANLLRGRSGPGPKGGLETDKINLPYYLIGYSLKSQCSHREVAERALEMAYCPLVEVWHQTRAMPEAKTREQKVCPKTKQHFFLPALAAVLGDGKLTAECVDVGVCSALALAFLDFVPLEDQTGPWALTQTRTRSLFCTRDPRDYRLARPGSHTVSHFDPFIIADLLNLIRKPDTPARAGTSRAARKRALSHA